MAKKKIQAKPKIGRPFAKKKPKMVVAVTLEPDVVKRLDEVAAANEVSRSRQVELYIREGLEEGEFAAKAFANPAIMRAMGKALADRSVIKQIAAAMTSDSTPDQLKLFEQAIESMQETFDKKRGAK